MKITTIVKEIINGHWSERLITLGLFLGVFLILCAVTTNVSAEENEEEIPFDVATLYFELNNTDGDLGFHGLIDGDAWKRLEVENPKERRLLNVFVQSRLRRQGLTEFFFESAEPTFDELAPEKFFRRFPEGEYEISGVTLEGEELESTAMITHLLPAPPDNITVNGQPVPEDCDEGPVPVVNEPVVVTWDPVTHSHPELGRTNEPIEVVRYEVVVEHEDSESVFNVTLPPEITSMEIPMEFLSLGEEFKLEVLAREASGNQTATETCFIVE